MEALLFPPALNNDNPEMTKDQLLYDPSGASLLFIQESAFGAFLRSEGWMDSYSNHSPHLCTFWWLVYKPRGII